jgi:hypothetical protein
LVQGTDERFIRTGPVLGCSGSPVYIEGRMAGALAGAWTFSKDPIYIVTPIEEILKVGRSWQNAGQMTGAANAGKDAWEPGFRFDFSAPLDFAEIDRQMKDTLFSKTSRFGAPVLPCPLVTSGLPAGICEQLNNTVEPFGLMAVPGLAGSTNSDENADVQLEPGASLALPYMTGDMTMTAMGTVTEVTGDQVYGFGHGFLGYGPVELPMATGKIHTVVSNVIASWKLGSAMEIVGALTADESAAIRGRIGAKARMIPLTIKVDRYNDLKKRVYNCRVADNRLITPLVLRSAVAGAVFMLGSLPPHHMIEYKVAIDLKDAESITFENVSTSVGAAEVLIESVVSVALLLNNPYEKVDITSIDFDVRIVPKNIVSHIWSVDLSDSRVKAGQLIDVSVVVESVLAGKKKYQYSLKIPDELVPGEYDLLVCGSDAYHEFLERAAPYRFVPQNLPTLIEAINNLLALRRDKLYCLLILPSGGVAVEKAELPDLPATKALVLGDAKRTLRTRPYQHWLEKSLTTGTVVIDKKVMHITVEK